MKYSYDKLIMKYLENTITSEEASVLLEWLKESEENGIELLNNRKIYNLRNLIHYSDPVILENAVQKLNHRAQSFRKQKRTQFIRTLAKYAAIIILILIIPAMYWFILREKPVQLVAVAVGRFEQIKTVILPDSSRVWINNESCVTYPISFKGAERIVRVTGEAYFEVKTDSLRPFIVRTPGMQVKVYGTSFNVNTNTSDKTIRTTLVSGRVAIRDTIGNNLAMLVPGQMASYNRKTQKIDVQMVDTSLCALWRKELQVFDKARLEDIVSKIEELYNVKVTINTNYEMQNKINFVFRKSQPLDTVMKMLKFIVPIDYKHIDDQVLIICNGKKS